MARKARITSSTGIYHVLVRAVSDISLFNDDEDTTIFIDALRSLQARGHCVIYTYSLHSTHVHLLIREGAPGTQVEPIGTVMRRLASTYSYYYNVKYDRFGPIYLDRFKSEPILDRPTFLACLSFIATRQALSKGFLTTTIPEFPDSPDPELQNSRITEFLDFVPRKTRMTDSRFSEYLVSHHHFTTPEEFLSRPDSQKTSVVLTSLADGANVLQIVRATGLTRKVILRMTSKGTTDRTTIK